MSDLDTKLLNAINGVDDDDNDLNERTRAVQREIDQGNEVEEQLRSDPNAPVNIDALLENPEFRNQIGLGGGPQTGPKGVLNDYRFHNAHQRVLKEEQEKARLNRINRAGLSSGWLQRQLEAEKREKEDKKDRERDDERSEDEDADDLIRQLEEEEAALAESLGNANAGGLLADAAALRFKRLQDYLRLQTLPRFGNLREIEAGDYVQAIDGAASDVKVLIHLYQPQIEACRQTNYFLSHLARKYPTIKFLKIVSTKADAKFDNVALPALLVYRGGSLIITILRIIDEVPGWASKGVCELEDFEELLAKKGVIDEAEIEAGFSGLTLEDPEDDI